MSKEINQWLLCLFPNEENKFCLVKREYLTKKLTNEQISKAITEKEHVSISWPEKRKRSKTVAHKVCTAVILSYGDRESVSQDQSSYEKFGEIPNKKDRKLYCKKKIDSTDEEETNVNVVSRIRKRKLKKSNNAKMGNYQYDKKFAATEALKSIDISDESEADIVSKQSTQSVMEVDTINLKRIDELVAENAHLRKVLANCKGVLSEIDISIENIPNKNDCELSNQYLKETPEMHKSENPISKRILLPVDNDISLLTKNRCKMSEKDKNEPNEIVASTNFSDFDDTTFSDDYLKSSFDILENKCKNNIENEMPSPKGDVFESTEEEELFEGSSVKKTVKSNGRRAPSPTGLATEKVEVIDSTMKLPEYKIDGPDKKNISRDNEEPIYINQERFLRCSRVEPRKFFLDMLTALFTKNELQQMSLTGHSSPLYPNRPAKKIF